MIVHQISREGLMSLLKWILPILLLAACSKNNQFADQAPYHSPTELRERNQVAVTDDYGTPVPNAEVHIGLLKLTTDESGLLNVPAAWTQEQPVTILKTGFVKTSYLKQKPQGQSFEIHHAKSVVRNEVKGSITGFGALPADGFIDFGLSMTSLNPITALNFDITQIISQENDTVSVMGQELNIPTNVFVPKQKENYSFLPVTIEKAFYRLFYDFQGVFKVQTNRGKFDFKKVADKLKAGKSFFEVVNDFEFLSMGTASVNVNQQNVAFDMDANQKRLVSKVPFNLALPQAGMLFGVTLLEENGRLYPADIKLREGQSQMLALPDSVTRGMVLLVNADKVQESKQIAGLSSSMSTALVDSEKISEGFLLDRIPAPEITSAGIKLAKPNLKGNLKGFATYAALSTVKTDKDIERTDVTWEIYSPGWVDTIELPDVTDSRSSQRWQIAFYGMDASKNKQFNGPKSLGQATHAVFNAVNF
jgi:hypothetical protein